MDTDSGAAADLGGESAEQDPFATVEADPLGGDGASDVADTAEVEAEAGHLGGTGATLDELEEAPAEVEEEAAVEPEPEPEPEAQAPEVEAKTAEPEPGPQNEPDELAEPATGGKVGTSEREYVVQRENGAEDNCPIWVEVTRIKAANGEAALRQAYAALVPGDSEEAVTLVVIPSHFFKPKTVKAKAKVNRAIEID